ncbi:hypothetical protein BJ742DRAFT_869847 [Cladochytrium replicatum]|nr:hypothetical protein BJ742DRAFT_869847 [Cladochytrium replicatum]
MELCLRFMGRHPREAVLKNKIPRPPCMYYNNVGLIAIVDLKGYSSLASELQERYGENGAATIQSIINPSFCAMIDICKVFQGSVVKFAGDSMTVVWCDHSKSYDNRVAIKDFNSSAGTTRLEYDPDDILYEFETQSQTDTSDAVKLLWSAIQCCLQLLGTMKKNPLQLSPGMADPWLLNRASGLNIHIGLGYGDVHHVYLGERGNRVEYIVTGTALAAAGDLLDVAGSSELAFPISCWEILSNTMNDRKQDPHRLLNPTFLLDKNCVIVRTHAVDYDALASIYNEEDLFWDCPAIETIAPVQRKEFPMTPDAIREWTGGPPVLTQTQTQTKTHRRHQAVLAAEEGLLITGYRRRSDCSVQQRPQGDPEPPVTPPLRISDASTLNYMSFESLSQPESLQTSTENIKSGSNTFMDSLYTYQGRPDTDVNEMRAVAVVFIRIPSFGKMSGVNFLRIAQEVMMVALEALKKYEGTVRQFHMDEKGATLLLLWGVEGSAHEQDCTIFALHAACEMKERLLNTVDDFSIGMSEGVVFSGIIGNEKRSDYTVLGVAVNEAARLMCTDLARRDVLVTDGVEQKGRSVFQFLHKDTVKLKGFRSSMRVHIPVRLHHTGQIPESNTVDTGGTQKLVLNREPELRRIESLLTSWKSGQLPVRLVLIGENGLGKSTLLWQLHHLASQHAESLICMGKGSETHKNVPFFCVKRMLEPLFHKVYDSYVQQSLIQSKADGEVVELSHTHHDQPIDDYEFREKPREKIIYGRNGSSHYLELVTEPKKATPFSTLHWSSSASPTGDCENHFNPALERFSRGSADAIEKLGRTDFVSESISLARRRSSPYDSKDQRTKRVALVLDALAENSEDYCLLNDVMDVWFYPTETTSHLRGANRVAAVQRVVTSILKKMTSMCQIPIVWIVDDAQWLDLVGYQLLLRIIEECPDMFIAVASRPVQEYVSSELSDCFKALCLLSRLGSPKPERSHFIHKDENLFQERGNEHDGSKTSEIILSGMDLKGTEALFLQAYQTHSQNAFGNPFPLVHAVEKRLLSEIHNCTSGNPMILSLMAQAMCTQQWLQQHPSDMARLAGSSQVGTGQVDPQRGEEVLGNAEMLFGNEGSSFRVDEGILKVTGPFSFNNIARLIPVDARSAIICQLDRVDPRMRHILRIASVAGPEFSVDELLAVLDMDPMPEDGSESEVLAPTMTNETGPPPPWSQPASSGTQEPSEICFQSHCDSKSSSLTQDLIYQFDLSQSEQSTSHAFLTSPNDVAGLTMTTSANNHNETSDPNSTYYSRPEGFVKRRKGTDDVSKKLKGSEALRKMILDLDLFGFLTPSIGEETSEGGQLHFRHYLIQRGIYQTLLPWRLQDVHHKYALYFESLLGSADLGYVLPQLNYHLDHCQHTMDPHKLALYAEQLFELYAKTNTISEAFKAFGRMVQILDDFPASQSAIRAVQRAKHLRQLSEMALLLHDHDLCLESTGRIGALLGINLPRSMSIKSVGMLVSQATIQIRLSLSRTESGRLSILNDMERSMISKPSKDKDVIGSSQSFSGFNIFGYNGGDPYINNQGHRMVAQELVKAACFRVRALYVTAELPVAATTELMYMNLAELFRNVDPSLLCSRMANMAVILFVMRLRSAALAFMRKALALQSQMEESCERDLTLSRIAVLYGFLGKWNVTFRYSEEAVTGLHAKGHSYAFTCFEAEFVLRTALYNLGLLKDCILACDRSFGEASEIFSEWTETLVTASQRAFLSWELQVADSELSYWYDVADSQNRSISSQIFARSEIGQAIPLDCQLLLSSAYLLRVDVGHFMALTSKHQMYGSDSTLKLNPSFRVLVTDDDCSSVFQRKNIIAHEFALIMDRIEFMLNTLKAMSSRHSQVLSMQLDALYHVILTAMFEWVPALIRLGECDRSSDPLTLSTHGSHNSQKEGRRGSLPQLGMLRKSRSMSLLEALRHEASGALIVAQDGLPGLLDPHIIHDGLKRTRRFLSALYQAAKKMAITNSPQSILGSIQALKKLTDGNPTQARVLLEEILNHRRTEEQLTKWIKANICARLIAVQAVESRLSQRSGGFRNKVNSAAAIFTSLRRFSVPGLRPAAQGQGMINFNFARTIFGSCGALWLIESLQRDFSSL